MPPDLMDRLREYAKARPRGALLRSPRGGPWTANKIGEMFKRARDKLGLDSNLVIYMARHAFATRLIKPGSDLALIAKLLGHTNAEVLQKTYYHPDTEAMVAMVEEENSGENNRVANIQEQVEAEKKERRRRQRNAADAKRKDRHNQARREKNARLRAAKPKTDTPPDA
jgi:hypothetical protein